MTLPPKRFPLSLIYEAITWAIRYKSKREFGEDQQRELYEFVCRSPTHFREFLNAADLCDRFGGPALPERSTGSLGSEAARFPEPPRSDPGGSEEPPLFPPLPVSRRAMFGMLGAGGAMVAGGAFFRLSLGLSEAFRDGHIQRFSLDGAVLFASRHIKVQIIHRQSLQIVRVLGEGLIALHMWPRAQRPVHVELSLRKIVVEAGEFSALVDGKIAAVVRKGRILVLDPAAPKKAGLWVGTNRRLTVRSRSALVEAISAAAAERAFTWTDGELDFPGGTIAEAAKAMNRFNVEVIDPAPDVAELPVGPGSFGVNKPERFAKLIASAHGLVTQKQGNRIFIFKDPDAQF